MRPCLALLLALLWTPPTPADELRVAVASNFVDTLKQLAARFEQTSVHKLVISQGSTGKHYAQIRNGAPFHMFFAADSRRPSLLEQEGLAISGSRFTYAHGSLVLWSLKPNYVDNAGKILHTGKFRHLAIANPRLAPYGQAAQAVLQSLGLWQTIRHRVVRGENVNQAFHFVMSGNAELGFVARSQLSKLTERTQGSLWLIDPSLYPKIEQQAVLLTNDEAAQQFTDFIKSTEGRTIIKRHGYDVP